MIVPSVSAAAGDPKVVIIVGATHGATAGYRADADVAYAEARKYTSNVIKVYSPNATWAKVKAAVVGASIVIYMGHGNGWPSPYTYDAQYTTKDGFGLNATAGAGDYNNKYYGEPYMASMDLAPGAIVLLHHLCYASGNSEPGNAEPSVTVARQRADNYAHGLPEGRGLGRHRRRARRRRALPARAVHDPSVDRGHVAHDAEPERQRRQVRIDADARRLRLPGSRSPRHRASIARWRSARSGSRPMRSSRPATATPARTRPAWRSPATPRSRPRAPASTAASTPWPVRRRRFPSGRALRVVEQPTQVTADGPVLVAGRGHR